MTKRIINVLIRAKEGDRDAAREFALLCNAKDEETIRRIIDIVLPINSVTKNEKADTNAD